MIAEPLNRVLEATGYLSNKQPAAPSVTLAGSMTTSWLPSFDPDACWRSNVEAELRGNSTTNCTVYFKFVADCDEIPIAEWQREIWNRGFAPLLWIVSPHRIDLYNGFGAPQKPSNATANLLETFELLDEELARLDTLAGRLAMETGQFWRLKPSVNRDSSVAGRLLRDLSRLENDLVVAGLGRGHAQALIGRCIFVQYLIDRALITKSHLTRKCGHSSLPDVLFDRDATSRLFDWLRLTFNGDMFPPSSEEVPGADHLGRVARFLRADDTESGQLSLFPYRFDVIPVGLISSIYEQFVHSTSADSAAADTQGTAKKEGVYYTPLAAVSLVLDEIFDGLTGGESVLDLTCGSGVFLVEALRRLVQIKSGRGEPRPEAIRETLYHQIYGVDKSEAAVRVAAFSLYLAALELDPTRQLDELPPFRPLMGSSLLVGDAHDIEDTRHGAAALREGTGLKKFDVIVGNPPWTFKGKEGTATRRARTVPLARLPRGEGLDFVERAKDFAHPKTKFGMILSATPFFSRSATGREAVRQTIGDLSPVTLVNLSGLSGWLFRNANMPAVALLARHRWGDATQVTLVQTHWSQSGVGSHTIAVAPSDVTSLPLSSWKRNPGLFKTALLGRQPDLLLVDRLSETFQPLSVCLAELNTEMHVGLQLGTKGQRNAGFLSGLPFATKRTIGRFKVPGHLPPFERVSAQWPRSRNIYRSPLLLVQENLYAGEPRPITAVAERDIVYTAGYFGTPFTSDQSDIAYLLAGILGSALASWFFLMVGSSFGIWKRRVMQGDYASLPTPALAAAVRSRAGEHVTRLVRDLQSGASDNVDWEALDNGVFELYGLDPADRITVRDGLVRASWQWKRGRLESVAPASAADCENYARAFLFSMEAWLSVSGRRRMRAEVYDLHESAPIRVVRFALENKSGPSVIDVVSTDKNLTSVLTRISERTKVQIATELVGVRELRVHAQDEVAIIKPSALRHWLGVCGLEDADAVLRDSISGNGGQ